jgi:F420-non-reducing hydrogenase iron-sulfur subunit
VIISGCHPGDCHYVEGNYKALRRTALMHHLLKAYGINAQRLRLVWVSAAEGEKWAKIATDMTRTIKQMGSLKLHNAAVPAESSI